MNSRSPFSPLSALALVLAGGALLVAMLWMIGAGVAAGDINDGGAHGGGRGLNGYGALYRLLEATGHDTDYARDDNGLRRPGLLILTPPHEAQGADISRIVALHRGHGPVLIITPKWTAAPASTDQPGVQDGWVRLGEARTPEWEGFLDDVGVAIGPAAAPVLARHPLQALPHQHHLIRKRQRKVLTKLVRRLVDVNLDGLLVVQVLGRDAREDAENWHALLRDRL